MRYKNAIILFALLFDFFVFVFLRNKNKNPFIYLLFRFLLRFIQFYFSCCCWFFFSFSRLLLVDLPEPGLRRKVLVDFRFEVGRIDVGIGWCKQRRLNHVLDPQFVVAVRQRFSNAIRSRSRVVICVVVIRIAGVIIGVVLLLLFRHEQREPHPAVGFEVVQRAGARLDKVQSTCCKAQGWESNPLLLAISKWGTGL